MEYRSLEELQDARQKSVSEVAFKMPNLDTLEITTTPISFYAKDFESEFAFGMAMDMAAKHFASDMDTVVRYSKPYNDDKTEVLVKFEILKSKSRVFSILIKELGTIKCLMKSAGDVKNAIKFFNSLGVKQYDGESIKDLSEEIRATMKSDGVYSVFEILYNDEGGSPIFEWYPYNGDDVPLFGDIKEEVKNGLMVISRDGHTTK